jgi:hypothetical protein
MLVMAERPGYFVMKLPLNNLIGLN